MRRKVIHIPLAEHKQQLLYKANLLWTVFKHKGELLNISQLHAKLVEFNVINPFKVPETFDRLIYAGMYNGLVDWDIRLPEYKPNKPTNPLCQTEVWCGSLGLEPTAINELGAQANVVGMFNYMWTPKHILAGARRLLNLVQYKPVNLIYIGPLGWDGYIRANYKRVALYLPEILAWFIAQDAFSTYCFPTQATWNDSGIAIRVTHNYKENILNKIDFQLKSARALVANRLKLHYLTTIDDAARLICKINNTDG